jgi:ABC-2 type transport system ATP-binding protein
VIETSGLTKRFGPTLAVDGISVRVCRGQVYGFLGPNGSGKTTTIGMLLGILTPTAGSFRLLGRGPGTGLHRARRRIGAILEQPNFYPYLTGRENLRIVANVKGASSASLERALDLVGMSRRAHDRFDEYSLGMKGRLALAATLLGEPELVILDEPANGLDPEGMREIREIIGRMAGDGTTIFLSSHLLWEVERTCTHVAIIRDGRVVRQGSVEEITGDRVVAVLEAADPERLRAAALGYPGAAEARREGVRVLVELEDEDLAALNRYLVGEGIHLSHLSRGRKSLEDVFMELTGTPAPVEV